MKSFYIKEVRELKKFKFAALLGAVTVSVLSYVVREEKKSELKNNIKEPV